MMKRILVLSVVCVMIQMAHAEVAVTGYEFAHGKAVVSGMAGITNTPPPDALYRDPRQPIDKRVEDLIGYMELREKFAVGTMTGCLSGGGIPRIGLGDFRTLDGPNGPRTELGENKPVTYFPAPIAYAACWDKELVYQIGRALGEETRGIYKTAEVPARMLLGPTVNISRSPLGGRAFENFGEDPVLAGKTASAYCRGLQSVKVSPCIKHFLLNDQEWCRVVLDVDAPERAIREIYARPFEITIEEADVWSAMNAYNAVRGKFAANNPDLQAMLFEMGFSGSVFADWGGFKSAIESYNAGTTMWTNRDRSWKEIDALVALYEKGVFDKSRFDDNLRRNLRHAFRIGAFDQSTDEDAAEQKRCEASVGSKEHLDLAYRTAAESFVLLRNENDFLPLDRSKIRKVAIVGPGSDQHYSMIDGRPEPLSGGAAAIFPLAEPTILEAFVKEFGKENVIFAPGFRYHLRNDPTVKGVVERSPVAAAREADLVVFCGGTDHDYDREASGWGYVQNSDKPDIDLEGPQARLIARLAKVNPNIVVALNIGSPVSVEPWDGLVKSIIVTWYSGQTGSKALCDTILGRINPSGRLPYTFGRELEDWPCHRMGELCYPGIMTDILEKTPQDAILAKEYYSDGIWVGYRGFEHFKTSPKYPFGFGLSYTKFTMTKGAPRYSVSVSNVGRRNGRCVVQCYVSKPDQGDTEMPVKELVDFESVDLRAGETCTVVFKPKVSWFRYWNERENRWKVAEGRGRILVGFSTGEILCDISEGSNE